MQLPALLMVAAAAGPAPLPATHPTKSECALAWNRAAQTLRSSVAQHHPRAAFVNNASIYGVDFFGAAGVYGVASYRDLTDPPRGYTGLRRVPIDLTFNLGFRIDTSAGGFVFAFSNLLGLFPVRGEAGP